MSVSCVLALPSALAGVQDDSVGGGPDSLWTGHSNGVVVRWHADPLGRMGSWGAHRNGGVAALCLTASCCSSTSVDGVDATAVLVKHGPLEHQGPQDLL